MAAMAAADEKLTPQGLGFRLAKHLLDRLNNAADFTYPLGRTMVAVLDIKASLPSVKRWIKV